jgi:WD40 repeat protein
VSAPPDCPAPESWQALFRDAVPPEQRERYERHLESCAACQERLDHDEAGGDEIREVGRKVGDPTVAPADPTVVQVVDRVLHEVKAPERTPAAEPVDLHFLRPADRPDILGTLGAYEVCEVIGQGGMGVVLKAFEPALHRLVAIKVLAPALGGSATARRRFTREAQAAAAVRHDNVVAVHGVSEAGGLPYLVMQYVAGESLQARLDRTGPLDIVETVGIGLQTASGLAAAHAQGLIHRDIKPANLLLENGLARVKITDFGLARTADDVGLTQAGVVAGTPEYMAPEQARGEQVDHRADLFSLGSVLYACCTGCPPFQGATTLAVIRQVNDQAPKPLRVVNPEVPAWLEALVMRLLRKDPAERVQSAAEVAALLEGYLAHLRQPDTVGAPALPPLPAGSGAAPPRRAGSAPWFRRLLWPAALLLLAAVGLGVARIPFGFPWGGGIDLQAPAGNEPAAPARRLQGHTGPVHCLRFTPDGQRLISASGWPGDDHGIRVWDLATNQELARVPTPGNVGSLDLTPDGRFALAGLSNGLVLSLDLDNRQVVKTIKGHSGSVAWVAFAPDREHTFSASADGTARLWDLGEGQELAQVRVQDKRARGAAAFPDGRRLLTGDSGHPGLLQIWDLTTGQEVKRIDTAAGGFIDSLTLLADGRQALVTGVGGVHLYDLETGQEIRRFQGDEPDREEVNQAVLSPDGRRLLTASFDGKVRLWDFPTGQLLGVLGSHNGFVWAVAFSPDGRLAASAGGGEKDGGKILPGTDHDIRLWDLAALPAGAAAPHTYGGRGWSVAAGIVFLLIVLSSLAVWYSVRRGRRAGKKPADVPAPDKQDKPAAALPSIAVTCSGCGENLKARAGLAGKRVKCPKCGRAVLVPAIKTADSGISPA